MSLPKTPPLEDKAFKAALAKEEPGGLPELKEKTNMLDHSRPLPASLRDESIPEEVLLSLTYAAHAGPCPEHLLPLKKSKTPKGTLPRPVDHVWHHPVRRNKFKYLIDHPVSLTGAGREPLTSALFGAGVLTVPQNPGTDTCHCTAVFNHMIKIKVPELERWF